MSTRLIRKQTSLTYEPPDAPGIVVEYTLHPEQPFKPATRDSEGQEYIPARVEVETVTVGNLTEGQRYSLTRVAQYLEDLAETDARGGALALGKAVRNILSTKPANLLPWLQLHGADEDEVCERLAEGIAGNHR
jgi:hypothetical protein